MTRYAAALVGVVLLAAACGDTGEVGGTRATSTTAAPATTTTSTAPAVTTTTSLPETTTTAAAPPPITTVPAPVDVDGYDVAGVAADDVLNIRAEPNASAEIVGTYQPDATGVRTSGNAAGDWWEVEFDGATGWVKSTFLALPGQLVDDFTERPCAAGPGTGDPGTLSDADHVLALDYLPGPDCDRFTVLLGTGAYGYGPLWPLNPDLNLPEGVAVTGEGSVVTISLPNSVDLVRPTADTGDYDDPLAFVVRREDGGLDVKLHYSGPVDARPSLLANPARVVVDVTRLPFDEGDALPLYDGFTAVLPLDPIGEGLVPPITIRGYGRPFEAQGDVELRELTDGPSGSGAPVDGAVWDGIAGEVTGFGTGYMTTDWTSAWGAFEVTLVSVPEGGFYELFVGQVLPDDEGTMSGVYLPLALIVD